MNKTAVTYLVLSASLFAATLSLSGCSTSGPKAEDLAKLQQENATLKADIESLKKQMESKSVEIEKAKDSASEPAESTGSTTDSTAAATNTAESNAPKVSFTDIADVFGEKEIKRLTELKVIDDGATFDPTKPISRAQFVDWLVKANNIIKPKKYMIRKAEKSAKPAFTDVPATNPAFPSIQGMSDSDWSIGFTDKTFRPDQNLTREQMIAIKAPLDYQQKDLSNYLEKWRDNAKISKDFKATMNLEAFAGHNWERVFGATKSCDPQKPVTRAEAAVCLYQFYSNQQDYSAADPQGGT